MRLKTDDQAGSRALTRLSAAGAVLSREVRTALAVLSSEQLASAEHGALTEPAPGLYLEALEDLTVRDGAPPATQGTRPDPQRVNVALAEEVRARPAADGGTPTWPWIAGAGLLVAGLGWWARPRRRPTSPPVAPPVAAQPRGGSVHLVLDASRRLTTLTADDDMSRAIVREALSLVPALAAALVERQGESLVVGHESQPGLLVPAGFSQGVIDAAAHGGRPLAQMVADDASFSRLPAQVLLLPLISGGRVDAVLVVLRDAMETFTTAERELLATFGPVAAATRESAARTQAAVDASQIDPLTGAGNRRQLDTHLHVVLRDAAGASTGFFMIDLDHFKSINDTYGHPVGDSMLRQVCGTIRSAVRPTDGVYRYGGEEFCVLLPTTTLEEAADIAERVRAAIATSRYDVGGPEPLTATASLGVAATADTEVGDLIDRADRALYEAKVSGRNTVRCG